MDLTLLVIVIVVIVVVLIALYWQSRPGRKTNMLGPKDLFQFDTTNPNVKRKVSISAEPQLLDGRLQPLKVVADPLPEMEIPVELLRKKSIRKVFPIIEPRVFAQGSEKPLYDFKPPLHISAEFTAADVEDAQKQTGSRELMLYTGYMDSGRTWHVERLKTTMTWTNEKEGGTLEADIFTLHPEDPVYEGYD